MNKITIRIHQSISNLIIEPYGYEIKKKENDDVIIECNIIDNEFHIIEKEGFLFLECYDPIIFINGEKIIEI
jgi:chaperonin cofactor prefoldin